LILQHFDFLTAEDGLTTMPVEPLINCLIDNLSQSKHPILEVKALLQTLEGLIIVF
jgi:hypothetical protein